MDNTRPSTIENLVCTQSVYTGTMYIGCSTNFPSNYPCKMSSDESSSVTSRLRLYPREFHRYTVIQFIGDRVSCVCYCKKKKKEKRKKKKEIETGLFAIDESMITPINRDSFYLIILGRGKKYRLIDMEF